MCKPLNFISPMAQESKGPLQSSARAPGLAAAPNRTFVDKLANAPKPIKWLSEHCHWEGGVGAPPCQACELNGQAWQRQPVPASRARPRQCGWQMSKKRRKKREAACGSLIESRSGLSWWGGGDDREEGVEDYSASGSLSHPVGWPQAALSPSHFSPVTLSDSSSPQRSRAKEHAHQALPRMCAD